VFKILKKTLILVSILGVAGFLVFGAGLSSYMRTGYKQVKKQLKSSIPIEFEIHRIEDLIEQISPEIKEVEHQIAEEQVSIVELKSEVVHLNTAAMKKAEKVKIIRTSLNAPAPQIRRGGLVYKRDFVETDLGRRLDNLKAMHSLINTKNRLLASRERSLEAARTQLVNFNSERTRLETMVQQLRTELRELESLQSTCLKVKIDDSKLKQAQDLARKVKKSLDVKRTVLENKGINRVVVPEINLEPAPDSRRDVCSEVDSFFEEDRIRFVRPAPVKISQKN